MAKGQYVGVNGVARKVTSPYIGVNGVARNVKSGYVGVDGVARLFFAPDSNEPVVLEVKKITSKTYANSTTYENEEFILLDIYPKTGGTVNVTYGSLTKTITDTSGAAEPNAQQIFFGTFNGVSDSVATPTSGILTVEGDYKCVCVGDYKLNSKDTFGTVCGCVTGIIDFGSIKVIYNEAFSSCTGLTSVTIPASVKSIGNNATFSAGAFTGCIGLTNLIISDGVQIIGYAAFSNCTGLTSVTIPASVQIIGNLAFYGCTGLTSVTIPASVQSIGDSAFGGCTGLTSVTIPASVQSIGNNPFANINKDNIISLVGKNPNYRIDGNCLIENANNKVVSGFNNSVIPASVQIIGNNAFYGCTGLTSVTIPASVQSIGYAAFSKCTGLTSVDISNGVTSIGSVAFIGCTGLTNVIIPNSVTSIGDSAFSGCTGLTSVDIPDGVTSISDGAFDMCNNILDITIPANVTYIGSRALYKNDTSTLRTVIMLPTTPPTLGSESQGDVFGGVASYTYKIIVPKGCLSAYKSANVWSKIDDGIIVEAT